MSKKNKNKDQFNITVEEARRTADLINELVKGNKNVDINDIFNDSESDGNVSNFTKQIEEFVISKIDDGEYFHYEPENSNIPVISVELKNDEATKSVIDNSVLDKTRILYPVIEDDCLDIKEAPSVIDNRIEPKFNEINIRWNLLFNAVEIYDGEVIHYFNLDSIQSTNPFIDGDCELLNIISGSLDDDELGSIFSELFYYIITKKVPTMIIPANDFEVGFGIFSKVNSRYIFFKKNDYVLVYTIESSVYDDFYNYIGMDSNFTPIEVIKCMINVINELDKSNVIFTFDNNYIVNTLVDYSKKNIKAFIEKVSLDAEFAGHDSFNTTVWKTLKVLDYDSFVSNIKNKLSISYNSDLEDDNIEQNVVESNFDDYPDLSDVVGNSESLLSEPPKIIEPIKPNNTESMTIPIIRKKK